MARGLLAFDRRQMGGADAIIGVDEAGRGALAGPVFAGAVRLHRAGLTSPWLQRHARSVDDSKRLSAQQREAIVARFSGPRAAAFVEVAVASATVAEIDALNILGATQLAMERALRQLLDQHEWGPLWVPADQAKTNDCPVIVDGRPLKQLVYPHSGIVKGDQKSFSIALAGIFAKVGRDAWMQQAATEFPDFAFDQNKGYGTEAHCRHIIDKGPCALHRELFLRKLLTPAYKAQSEARNLSLFDHAPSD